MPSRRSKNPQKQQLSCCPRDGSNWWRTTARPTFFARRIRRRSGRDPSRSRRRTMLQQQCGKYTEPDAPLPDGWVELVTDDGTPYFFRASDQTTQWTRPPVEPATQEEPVPQEEPKEEEEDSPVLAAGSSSSNEQQPVQQIPEETVGFTIADAAGPIELPEQLQPFAAGWIELATDDGTPYFYRASDQTTQWTRPGRIHRSSSRQY